ncbi:MAG: FumA C-terminus/TtdB family hydratase beta subunit [Candidatus Altiarchaeia archaeon]
MYLITPLKNADIRKLALGDIVYITGRIYTARDKAHQKALAGGRFPGDIKGGVVFHCGPIAKKEKTGWKMIAIGPTTSSRMNTLEPDFIEKFGVAAIIGKGGMDKKTAGAMKGKAVYLAMTGGCAATAGAQIKKVVSLEWPELGEPEAVWALEAEKLGPLIVAMDANGNSIYDEVNKKVKENLEKILTQ